MNDKVLVSIIVERLCIEHMIGEVNGEKDFEIMYLQKDKQSSFT